MTLLRCQFDNETVFFETEDSAGFLDLSEVEAYMQDGNFDSLEDVLEFMVTVR